MLIVLLPDFGVRTAGGKRFDHQPSFEDQTVQSRLQQSARLERRMRQKEPAKGRGAWVLTNALLLSIEYMVEKTIELLRMITGSLTSIQPASYTRFMTIEDTIAVAM